MSNKPRILYISSASPVRGPGVIGWGHVKNLRAAGYDVDMLTLFKEPSLPEVLYIKKDSFTNRFLTRLKKRLFVRLPGRPHYFFYKKESTPPVSVRKVLSQITKDYDLVFIYFWQEMLSFKTVEAIYDKLNHPVIFFLCPDYSHMSGGCHFTCDCERYKTGCGKCPAIKSKKENDFTRWNVEYRKRFYEKVKPVVLGNNYMNMFYRQSYLLGNARTELTSYVFDVTTYKPVNRNEARTSLGIDDDVFVIAFGCQQLSDPRKGILYLVKSLEILKKKLPKSNRKRIILLVAGNDYLRIKESLPFDSMGTGYLPVEKLSEFYSAANIFVCPSVDDAGPSMVAQSISCGTPVVGFKMGAMLDVVLDKGTGYCAELMDSEGLANGILKYYQMNDEEYDAVTKHCRQFALENSCFDRRIEKWMELYEKFRVK